MKPGDRVRSRKDGRRGTVELARAFGTTSALVQWDDGSQSFFQMSALDKEPCPRMNECPILRSFRDRDVPEAIYEDMLREFCATRCEMKEEAWYKSMKG